MPDQHHPFELELKAAWPPEAWADVTVLAAVSGGPDSVALLRGLIALRQAGCGRLLVAHYNHRLRPESDADAAFVRRLCEQFQLELHQHDAQTGGPTNRGDGLEEAARHARYEFLKQTAQRLGARYVVTGHTADDQAETVLHHILRGTGLTGLGGMPRSRPLCFGITLMRPLLAFRRRQVLEYLDTSGQPFCRDATNEQLHWTRNRIRHDLLPRLEADYNRNVVDALLRLSQLAQETQSLVDQIAAPLAQRCTLAANDHHISLDCGELARNSRALVVEVLRYVWTARDWPRQGMNQQWWNELTELVFTTPPTAGIRHDLPGRIRAERRDEILELSRPLPTTTG